MKLPGCLLISTLAVLPRVTSFELWKFYDRAYLRDFYDISDRCISALNSTVACHEATTAMAGQGVDLNYWYMNNLTDLCTSNCEKSLKSWLVAVESGCSGESVAMQGGIRVQAKSLALQFTYNYDLACMKDSNNDWCFFKSQHWAGSDYVRWDPIVCASDPVPDLCKNATFSIDDVSDSMREMTRLYDSSLYCSKCFLNLLRQRLLDPWLVKADFTNYLIDQFATLQKKCSISLPYVTSSSTLYITSTATQVATKTLSQATTTCTGRTLAPLPTSLICNDLSDKYNVSTGDIRVATGDYNCAFNEIICLPPPCEMEVVWDQLSCAELAVRYSTPDNKVDQHQLLSWNPHIQGSCDGIAMGQRVCTRAPGGVYVKPSASIYAPTGTTNYFSTAKPPAPTQDGSIPNCGAYYLVVAGDNCYAVAMRFGITLQELRQYNSYLTSDCKNLWLAYSVCVAPVTPTRKSMDGSCSPGISCEGTTFGSCCSPDGKCSQTGCKTPGSTVTTDGTCGPTFGGSICPGSNFGSCCSIYGYCGNGKDFCGPGKCHSGQCDPDIGGLSINGECGPNFAGNKICTGTQFGKCCSTTGYCGSTSDYCRGKNCYSGDCSRA